MYQLWYTVRMDKDEEGKPILNVVFYKTESGKEPVREWLKDMPKEDRQAIGEDIKTAQFGWPLGMPLIRKIERGLWEVRSHIGAGIARVFFTVMDKTMILFEECRKGLSHEQKTHRKQL